MSTEIATGPFTSTSASASALPHSPHQPNRNRVPSRARPLLVLVLERVSELVLVLRLGGRRMRRMRPVEVEAGSVKPFLVEGEGGVLPCCTAVGKVGCWRTHRMTGTTRSRSSCSLTRSAPGRVDCPPMSMMLAPAAAISTPSRTAAATLPVAQVRFRVGVQVCQIMQSRGADKVLLKPKPGCFGN